MENNSDKKKVTYIQAPAIPIMQQTQKWLKATGKPIPITLEGWIRASNLFIRTTSHLN